MKVFDKKYNVFVDIIEIYNECIRLYHLKVSEKGINCYQWWNTTEKRFKDRFDLF